MAGVIVGVIRRVDEASRTVVVGGTEFSVPDSVPLAALVPGVSVTMTYRVVDGRHVAVEVRTNPPR